MNKKIPMPNWSLLQSFAAVAEYGSLSAAARAIGVSQPTLSRHVSELEKIIGQRLFFRTPAGLQLSPKGEQLIHHAVLMNDAAHQIINLKLFQALSESLQARSWQPTFFLIF